MGDTRKDNITVEDYEDKKYGEGKKAGRYTRFKTDQGWISSFHKPTIEKLKDSVDKKVRVEIETDKNDKEKIIKFVGDADDDDDEVSDDEEPRARKSVQGSAYEKDPVGLAVEIFCTIWPTNVQMPEPKNEEAVMELADDLVKQAQESFE